VSNSSLFTALHCRYCQKCPSLVLTYALRYCIHQTIALFTMICWHSAFSSRNLLIVACDGPTRVCPRTPSLSVQPFCRIHRCAQHNDRHTYHGMCNMRSNRPHLCYAFWCRRTLRMMADALWLMIFISLRDSLTYLLTYIKLLLVIAITLTRDIHRVTVT